MTTPRPLRYYLWRASFACFLFILLWTAWQTLIGWQDIREVGVLSRFGGIIYWMFAMLQLTLMLFFAPLFTAAAVSYEKDRRTFTLLLMTDLSDLEIVLGKLVAGLLNILTILGASIGLLSICVFFGGISFGQVINLFAVTAASGMAGGALGLLIALLARSDVSVDLVDHPHGGLLGRGGRGVRDWRSPRLSSWECRWSKCSILIGRCWPCFIPASDQLTGVVRASSVVYISVRHDLRGGTGGLWDMEAAEMEPRLQRAARGSRGHRSRGDRVAYRSRRGAAPWRRVGVGSSVDDGGRPTPRTAFPTAPRRCAAAKLAIAREAGPSAAR